MSNKIKGATTVSREKTIDGRYKVVREIGQGAAGKVYEGVQTAVGRRVAIKILNRSNYEREDYRERFTREAKAIARLGHTNCVTLHDFGFSEEFESLYMVMEFVRGVELYDLIKDEPLPFRRALRVAIQISEALAHAHKRGILHRDLKPENVLVGEDDEVKVLDFGLARMIDMFADEGGRRLTAEGAIFGTPAYMSPEQCSGDLDVTVQSDIYSLGIVLYQLFEGDLPFDSKEVVKILVQHTKSPPPPMQAQIPIELKSLIGQMLEKEKAKRPSTATQVADTLRAVLLGIAVDDGRLMPDVSKEIRRSILTQHLDQSRELLVNQHGASSREVMPRQITEDGPLTSPRAMTPQQPRPAERRTAAPQQRLDTEHLVGRTLDMRYQLGKIIAEGAMSTVFGAADDEGNIVAIKILKRAVPTELRASERFSREIQLLRRLDHPTIVQLLDHGNDEQIDRLFLVTELVDGDTVERLCEHGRAPVELALLVANQMLHGLRHAHRQGAIHRDLKPSNIMLAPQADGTVHAKLLDFGLGRLVDEGPRLTNDGIPGTMAYLSPEQLRGEDASSASDVYSMGVVLYQMLSGHRPFEGRTPQQVAAEVQNKRITPLSNFVHEVPPQLSDLIDRMMRRDPSRRPTTDDALQQIGRVREQVNLAPVRIQHIGPASDPETDWRLRRRVALPVSGARPINRPTTSAHLAIENTTIGEEWNPRSREWIVMLVVLLLLAGALGVYLTVISPPQ